jgi:hypothetical protein
MKRMKFFLSLLIFVFVPGLASEKIFAQSVGNPAVTRYAEMESGDRFTVAVRTRKGANVYGVKMPSAAMLDAIDRGLDDLFAAARRHGYRARLNHSFYSIYIAKPDRVRDRYGNYSPAFAINAGEFGGSQYDQGGFIYVAGLNFYMNPDAILIVDFGNDLNSVSEIVKYEGEHIVLYHNDRRLYQQTTHHHHGGGHPILR